MKHLMTAALALTLMSGTSALAEPPDSSAHHGGSEGGGHAAAAPSRPAPQAAPAAPRGPQGAAQGYQGGSHGYPGAAPNNTRPSGGYPGGYQGGTHAAPSGGYQGYQGGARGAQGGPASQGATHNGYQGASGAVRTGQGAAQGQGGAHAARGVPSNYSPRFGAPGFRPGPGAARPRYSAQYFPRVFQPDRQYAWRGGVWSGPPGYYYRHWGYGDRLPYGWFAAQWFINDYYYYDLAVPPYGYEWVRVGPDALLVDTDDGTVVESVYGIFY